MESPVFNVEGTNGRNLKNFTVSDFSLVKRIDGTEQDGKHVLQFLSFATKDNETIDSVELSTYTFSISPTTTFKIDKNEEIIGIYGAKGLYGFC